MNIQHAQTVNIPTQQGHIQRIKHTFMRQKQRLHLSLGPEVYREGQPAAADGIMTEETANKEDLCIGMCIGCRGICRGT